jgi:hypothetical protein
VINTSATMESDYFSVVSELSSKVRNKSIIRVIVSEAKQLA